MKRADHIDVDRWDPDDRPRFDLYDVLSWDREGARAAQRVYEATPRERRMSLPPMAQWYVWRRELPALALEHSRTGSVTVLLRALLACRHAGLPPMRWMEEAARDLEERLRFGEYESLRELLGIGRKPPPGTRRLKERQERALQELLDRRAAGETMTRALHDVGAQYGVAPGTLENLFLAHRRRYPRTLVVTAEGLFVRRTGDPDSTLRPISHSERAVSSGADGETILDTEDETSKEGTPCRATTK